MMDTVVTLWPLFASVASVGFFAGGLYSVAKNSKNAVTKAVFDEFAKRMDAGQQSIDARLGRIEKWIDAHS